MGGAAAILALALALVALAPAQAHALDPSLKRSPYLTDLVGGAVTVNWATDRSATTASVTWGEVGTQACSANTLATPNANVVRTSITVNNVAEYQWRATITGLKPDTRYCYRVFLGTKDLLGIGTAAPQFVTQAGPASTGYSFAVFGDWGQLSAAGTNPHQANVMQQIAASNARFGVMTGDVPYGGAGGQTSYGDLAYSLSSVFAPNFWANPGDTTPVFSTLGNHGLTRATFDNWPQFTAASSSGGRNTFEAYASVNGSTVNSYPRQYYAFNAGGARFYVLQAAWPNSNVGTGSTYANDYAFNWDPTNATLAQQYRWLKADLAANPSPQLKFAFFHFPLYSDNTTETSDTFLRMDGPAGAESLEGLLSRNGVDIVFNGHAHMYERNLPQNGVVSYITGGAGANLQGPTRCSAFDAYSIGWSNSGNVGRACKAPLPASIDRVFHFLLVTVRGTSVTVTPTDSLGRTFDVQTYDFAGGTPPPPADNPPSTPTNLNATPAGQTAIDLAWTASNDDVGVRGYNVYVNGSKVTATPTPNTSYSATGLTCGTAYNFAVEAVDTAGQPSPQRATATATTNACGPPPPPPPGGLALVKQTTAAGAATATSFTVPAGSTAGNSLVAAIAVKAASSATVTSVTDSSGGTWTRGAQGSLTGADTRIELWHRVGGGAATTVTVTLSAAKAAWANVSEWSGVTGVDLAAGQGNAASTTASTPSITTTNANDVVIGAANYAGTATSTLATSGFTSLSNFGNGRAAYRIVSATGAQQVSWTLSAAAASGGAILALRG